MLQLIRKLAKCISFIFPARINLYWTLFMIQRTSHNEVNGAAVHHQKQAFLTLGLTLNKKLPLLNTTPWYNNICTVPKGGYHQSKNQPNFGWNYTYLKFQASESFLALVKHDAVFLKSHSSVRVLALKKKLSWWFFPKKIVISQFLDISCPASNLHLEASQCHFVFD